MAFFPRAVQQLLRPAAALDATSGASGAARRRHASFSPHAAALGASAFGALSFVLWDQIFAHEASTEVLSASAKAATPEPRAFSSQAQQSHETEHSMDDCDCGPLWECMQEGSGQCGTLERDLKACLAQRGHAVA